ncbi:chorismate mutase [Rhodococcus rhodnii]|uniref:Chorismate mutase n=2 Tax=Rhodococcus rhodnii TaxID=38312 RepID=R7WM44_9NOCA|nr:chorismate mutase [Rhodococcus rhodnii]EOM76363.1 chorismate mutase [Rhodococcus rhodnii LMG 5362]TXG90387.1 chorismate mutase [Rhodococcus rhodnii]
MNPPTPQSAEAAADVALNDLRAALDTVDRQLLDAVSSRLDIARRIADVKARSALSVSQPGRAARVTERAERYALGHGMSAEFARALYTLLIAEASRVEREAIARGGT